MREGHKGDGRYTDPSESLLLILAGQLKGRRETKNSVRGGGCPGRERKKVGQKKPSVLVFSYYRCKRGSKNRKLAKGNSGGEEGLPSYDREEVTGVESRGRAWRAHLGGRERYRGGRSRSRRGRGGEKKNDRTDEKKEGKPIKKFQWGEITKNLARNYSCSKRNSKIGCRERTAGRTRCGDEEEESSGHGLAGDL